MGEPLTEELLDELLSAPSVDDYLSAHELAGRTLSDYLGELLNEKGLVRKDVVRAAGIGDTFGYQVFTGARGASRSTLLPLAFAMGLTLRETNRLLRIGGASALSPKDRRDAIIIFCLEHDYTLAQADETLFSFGEKTLGPND